MQPRLGEPPSAWLHHLFVEDDLRLRAQGRMQRVAQRQGGLGLSRTVHYGRDGAVTSGKHEACACLGRDGHG